MCQYSDGTSDPLAISLHLNSSSSEESDGVEFSLSSTSDIFATRGSIWGRYIPNLSDDSGMNAYVIMQERMSQNAFLDEEESLRLHHSSADSCCGLLGYDNT